MQKNSVTEDEVRQRILPNFKSLSKAKVIDVYGRTEPERIGDRFLADLLRDDIDQIFDKAAKQNKIEYSDNAETCQQNKTFKKLNGKEEMVVTLARRSDCYMVELSSKDAVHKSNDGTLLFFRVHYMIRSNHQKVSK